MKKSQFLRLLKDAVLAHESTHDGNKSIALRRHFNQLSLGGGEEEEQCSTHESCIRMLKYHPSRLQSVEKEGEWSDDQRKLLEDSTMVFDLYASMVAQGNITAREIDEQYHNDPNFTYDTNEEFTTRVRLYRMMMGSAPFNKNLIAKALEKRYISDNDRLQIFSQYPDLYDDERVMKSALQYNPKTFIDASERLRKSDSFRDSLKRGDPMLYSKMEQLQFLVGGMKMPTGVRDETKHARIAAENSVLRLQLDVEKKKSKELESISSDAVNELERQLTTSGKMREELERALSTLGDCAREKDDVESKLNDCNATLKTSESDMRHMIRESRKHIKNKMLAMRRNENTINM